jgi:hypothetical protein
VLVNSHRTISLLVSSSTCPVEARGGERLLVRAKEHARGRLDNPVGRARLTELQTRPQLLPADRPKRKSRCSTTRPSARCPFRLVIPLIGRRTIEGDLDRIVRRLSLTPGASASAGERSG